MVKKVESKSFVEKDIIHLAVFKKKDKRTTYNMIYKDVLGASYIKRFNVTGVTRDQVYDLTSGKPKSTVLYFSANPNGEAELVNVSLRNSGSINIKKTKIEVDFSSILIKGRGSKEGNIVTKFPVKRIELKEKGTLFTLKPRKIWYDDTLKRLNVDERGTLGEFQPEDQLLIITKSGVVKTSTPELSLHFSDDMLVLEEVGS